MIEEVIFTNARGQSIKFSNQKPFLLQSIEGKADVSADIQTQSAPFQDGSTYIDSYLQQRSVALNVSILAENNLSMIKQRQLLVSVCNPKFGLGKLTYIKGNTKREIQAVVENVPVFGVGRENNGIRFQRTIINFLCPSPFWQEFSTESYKLEDFVSNFRFPFYFPVRFATRGDSKVLINNGDVPTPIVVEFRGPVENPQITNITTGEFIRVNREIPTGYKLFLDTSFGNKQVEIESPNGVKENAFHYIDLQSTFFHLNVGENRIAFITDSGNPEVYVKFKQRYLSV